MGGFITIHHWYHLCLGINIHKDQLVWSECTDRILTWPGLGFRITIFFWPGFWAHFDSILRWFSMLDMVSSRIPVVKWVPSFSALGFLGKFNRSSANWGWQTRFFFLQTHVDWAPSRDDQVPRSTCGKCSMLYHRPMRTFRKGTSLPALDNRSNTGSLETRLVAPCRLWDGGIKT